MIFLRGLLFCKWNYLLFHVECSLKITSSKCENCRLLYHAAIPCQMPMQHHPHQPPQQHHPHQPPKQHHPISRRNIRGVKISRRSLNHERLPGIFMCWGFPYEFVIWLSAYHYRYSWSVYYSFPEPCRYRNLPPFRN